MGAASSSLSPKQKADLHKRAVYCKERGMKVGTSAPTQTTILRDLWRKAGKRPSDNGEDIGVCKMPAGEIPINTTCALGFVRGGTLQGAGHSDAREGPRVHGAGSLTGSSLYWTGAAGGTLLQIDNTQRTNTFLDFDLTAALNDSSNEALILCKLEGAPGLGDLIFERIGFNSPYVLTPTAIGIRGVTGDLSSNGDNVKIMHCNFRNLDIAVKVTNDQGLNWAVAYCNFRRVETLFDLRGSAAGLGGAAQFKAVDVHIVEDRENIDVVMIKATNGSVSGHFYIYGGYYDRQASGHANPKYFTAADLRDVEIGGSVSVYDYTLLQNQASSGIDYTGAENAFFEVANDVSVSAFNCHLPDLPLVRIHPTKATLHQERIAMARFENCRIPEDRDIAGQLINWETGGYTVEAVFQNCWQVIRTERINCWVNRPAIGSSETHYDRDESFIPKPGNAITATWIGSASRPWTGLLQGLWLCDDALGSTTIADSSGAGNNVTGISSSGIVSKSPLAHLDRCYDASADADKAFDTGIDIDLSTTDFTLGFWAKKVSLAGQVIAFGIDQGTAAKRLRICEFDGDNNCRHRLGSGTGGLPSFTLAQDKTQDWFQMTVVFDSSETTLATFVKGIKLTTITQAAFGFTGTSNVIFGGDSTTGTRDWLGLLSHAFFINGYAMTDKEASEASLRASTTFLRDYEIGT